MHKNIDWQSLEFSYIDTDCHICYTWKDGHWDQGEIRNDPYVKIHIAATALHYGQAAFEGLKAFTCNDGKVKIFRADENARRMEKSASRILMPTIPESMFVEAVIRITKENIGYVPPYDSGGSLYIRPLLFGSGPRIGVQPSEEYTFIVFVLPVGDYYKGGVEPVSAVIVDDYDRSAPNGVGHVKVAGNYAASLEPRRIAQEMGYPINLYLDAKEHRFIDEFGTSNFVAVTKCGTFVTPKSNSILRSITNNTLMILAEDGGMKIEERPIEFDEIQDFTEVGACGTAVVITPVNRIERGDRIIEVGPKNGFGPVLGDLYRKVRSIQVGDLPDNHGWLTVV